MSNDNGEGDKEQRIWQVVRSIPPGRVCSYGDVARRAGLPGAARLVGRVLSRLPQESTLPWHRVINAAGRISLDEQSDGGRDQWQRLRAEGVEFNRSGRIDWKRFGWL